MSDRTDHPIEDVLAFLSEYVNERYAADRMPIRGTTAHGAIRGRFPGFRYADYGYSKFAQFLAAGNGRHFSYLVRGSQDELYPIGVEAPRGSEPTTTNYLLPEVWNAFVRADFGPYFYDKASGVFKAGEPCDLAREVAVTKISNETQKDWFREFVRETVPEKQAEAEQALSAPQWHTTVQGPQTFLTPSQCSTWKRCRIARVREHIEAWKAEFGVSPQLFASPKPIVRRPQCSPIRSPDGIREDILAAISRMPTEELLRIPIPAYYLLPLLRTTGVW